jgi:hypothetical protein
MHAMPTPDKNLEYETYVTFAREHQARARKASEVPAEGPKFPRARTADLGSIFSGVGALRPDISFGARFGNGVYV